MLLTILITVLMMWNNCVYVDAHAYGKTYEIKLGGVKTYYSVHPPEPKAHNYWHLKIRGEIINLDKIEETKAKLKEMSISDKKIRNILKTAGIECSYCKISIRPGGFATNISAQFLENLSEIKAIIYDQYTQELIFIGKENYSLPGIDLDDLAMALQVPKEDQWVDMDVDVDTSDVTFGDSRLVNSSTGHKLFSADYLLKNRTLNNVSDCMCWKRCGGDEIRRIWIYPITINLRLKKFDGLCI